VSIENVILRAFKEEAERICNQEIEECHKRVSIRLREVSAKIAMDILQLYTVERTGTTIRIEVKNPDL